MKWAIIWAAWASLCYGILFLTGDSLHWTELVASPPALSAVIVISLLATIVATFYLWVTISTYLGNRRWNRFQDMIAAGPAVMRYEIMKDSGIDPKDWPPIDAPGNQGPIGNRGPKGDSISMEVLMGYPLQPNSDILKKGDPL